MNDVYEITIRLENGNLMVAVHTNNKPRKLESFTQDEKGIILTMLSEITDGLTEEFRTDKYNIRKGRNNKNKN